MKRIRGMGKTCAPPATAACCAPNNKKAKVSTKNQRNLVDSSPVLYSSSELECSERIVSIAKEPNDKNIKNAVLRALLADEIRSFSTRSSKCALVVDQGQAPGNEFELQTVSQVVTARSLLVEALLEVHNSIERKFHQDMTHVFCFACFTAWRSLH